MNAINSKVGWMNTILVTSLGSLALLTGGATPIAAADKEVVADSIQPSPGEYANSLTLGVGHFWANEDQAAFMRRHQLPAGTFGGVEELHFERMFGEKGLFTLDGRGIFDNHDYSLQLGISHPDVGYVRGGYEQFRTWYDGSGGYSPLSNRWVSIYSEELFVDHGRAWIEAGLTLPEWPVFSVRYSYDFRDGRKDSTSWGDISLTGNTANLRAIVPTFYDINEQRHSVEADMTHTIGNTAMAVGVRYSHDDIDNSKNISRRPGDATRGRYLTQTDDTSADMFNAHASTETRFNQKVMLALGGSYTRLDTDIAGSRIYGPAYGSSFSPISFHQQSNDEGFFDLSGGARVDQYVGNLNLMLTPWKHWTIIPSLRIEHQDQSGVALFTETAVTNVLAPARMEELLNLRMYEFTDVTESLSMRYTGITNWSLYARGEWLQGQGKLRENEFDVEDVDAPLIQLQRVTDSERFVQKYVVGANWYPCRQANFAAQYYYRTRHNEYDHPLDPTLYDPPPVPVNTNNFYPAFMREQEFNTHDVNFRVTLRPRPNLTLVSRYDYTLTSYNMQGETNSFGVSLARIENAKATAHILSQSVSWSPLPQLYLQGSISYALQDTASPAAAIQTGTASNLVQNAENNYWNASVTAGWAFSKVSDLQAQYYYYRADNYDTGNANVGLPYGASAEQHGVTVTLNNRLRKNLIWKIQYGYFTGRDATSGGNNDYNAHLVYSSWQYLF